MFGMATRTRLAVLEFEAYILLVTNAAQRIRQGRSFDFSNVVTTSPLRAIAILPLGDFHEVSRAAGPK